MVKPEVLGMQNQTAKIETERLLNITKKRIILNATVTFRTIGLQTNLHTNLNTRFKQH